jgi:hypothetical protein
LDRFRVADCIYTLSIEDVGLTDLSVTPNRRLLLRGNTCGDAANLCYR